MTAPLHGEGRRPRNWRPSRATSARSKSPASSTKTRPTSRNTASTRRRVEIEFKASGDKTYARRPPAVHRQQVADRRRRIRQARRRQARASWCPAMSNRSSTGRRSTCATRRCWPSIARKSIGSRISAAPGKRTRVRQGRHRLEADQADRGRRRLRSAVDALHRPSDDDAMKSIVTEQATPADLQEIRLRQAAGDS